MLLSLLLAALPLSGCSGTPPQNLGVKEGRLKPCPNSPNCVSTQAAEGDAEHRMEPISYGEGVGGAKAAKATIVETIEDSLRTSIPETGDGYVQAEFTSWIFRFVDDVEFSIDKREKLIHFRSVSRLGESDMGVNRERMNKLTKDLEAKLGE